METLSVLSVSYATQSSGIAIRLLRFLIPAQGGRGGLKDIGVLGEQDMTDENFLRAIIADPDDDTPRLVYADWLEEHGDPRGEFIRVQCALARLSKSDRRRRKLKTLEAELLKKHGRTWTRPLRAIVGDFGCHRGFANWATGKARKILDHIDILFRLAPIQYLRVNDTKPHIEE